MTTQALQQRELKRKGLCVRCWRKAAARRCMCPRCARRHSIQRRLSPAYKAKHWRKRIGRPPLYRTNTNA